MQVQSVIIVAALLSLSMPTTAPLPRRDGQWDISIDVEIEGTEKKIPSRTIKQCITPEDVEAGRSTLLRHGHTGLDGCTASEHKVDGKRVTWSFKCSSPQSVTGTGEIVYTDDSAYTGTIKMASEGKAMTIKYVGKRLGDCAKATR